MVAPAVAGAIIVFALIFTTVAIVYNETREPEPTVDFVPDFDFPPIQPESGVGGVPYTPLPDPLPEPTVDPDPDILFGKDPKVFGEWKMVPVENNYNCEELAEVHRADWDNDGWFECGTYTYTGKVLINNPVYDQRLSIIQFEGDEFTHIWQDINQNMIIDKGDILEEFYVTTYLPFESHPFGQRHTNGNLIYEVAHSPELGEDVYSTQMRYWMKGK